MRAAVLALAILAGLVACGDDGPKVLSGRIVGMEYDDADFTPGYRVGDIYIPASHDSAHWKIQLECHPEGEVDIYRSWVEVDQGLYNDLEHGQYWPAESEGNCEVEK